jgi:hypothetical protein
LQNLKHVEVKLPLLYHTTNQLFLEKTLGLIKDCKNLKSITLRDGGYKDWPLLRHLGGLPISMDFWLEVLSRSPTDFQGYHDVGVVGAIGWYVVNDGPLSKVKRKMIFNIKPLHLALPSNPIRVGSTAGNQKLNRWLYMLHRHWGGELRFNGELIRLDDQHFVRVKISIAGPVVIKPLPGTARMPVHAISISASFKPVNNATEEEEWLGPFNDRSTRIVNHLANGHGSYFFCRCLTGPS